MNELALFAGAGGGILGGKLLGWRTVCAVEIEPYPIGVLIARQNEGILSPFPIWDDVRTFDGKPWRGIVDVVSGGFPCQDISVAGKGAGIEGKRSGLWKEMVRIVDEIRPKYVFMENSPRLVKHGLDVILAAFAKIGYDAEWLCLGAAEIGATHKRERFWLLAFNPNSIDAVMQKQPLYLETAFGQIAKTKQHRERWIDELVPRNGGLRTDSYSRIMRDFNVIPARVDRLKSLGNGQVPIVAATAWSILYDRINNAS